MPGFCCLAGSKAPGNQGSFRGRIWVSSWGFLEEQKQHLFPLPTRGHGTSRQDSLTVFGLTSA